MSMNPALARASIRSAIRRSPRAMVARAATRAVPGSSSNVQVEYNGVTIGPADVQVGFANPALLRRHAGFSTQAAVLNEDGTINGPSNPARRDSVIALFGTGFGLTNPPGTTGARNPLAPAKLRLGVRVQIGNAEAEVLYAGTAPTLLSGIAQINVRVPDPLTAPGAAVPVNVEAASGFTTISGWGATTVAFLAAAGSYFTAIVTPTGPPIDLWPPGIAITDSGKKRKVPGCA